MEKATMTHLTQTDINAHLVSLLEDYPFPNAMEKFAKDMCIFHDTGKLSKDEYIVAMKLFLDIAFRNMNLAEEETRS